MSSEARKHHYLPHFYLAGFTKSGSKRDSLYVLDKVTGEIRKSKPRNEACQKDYYRTSSLGNDDFAVERSFAQFENRLAPKIRRIIDLATLPENEELDELIGFVAQLFFRVPKARRFLRESYVNVANLYAKSAIERLGNADYFQKLSELMRAAGHDVPDDYTHQNLVQSFESGKIRPIPNQNAEISGVLDLTVRLFPLFRERTWQMLVLPEGRAEFVLADSPVVASPNGSVGASERGVDGLMSRDLFVPLSPKVALLGMPIHDHLPMCASEELVRMLNINSSVWAERYVYCSSRESAEALANEGKRRLGARECVGAS